jgi:hypothetical protein
MAVLLGIRKKAQSEVIGLLVIVIILIFMVLVYLGFSDMIETGGFGEERESIEAENALKALMNVEFEDYDDKTLEDLIVECNLDFNSCESLGSAVKGAYEVILRPGVEFSFFVNVDGEEIYSFGSCDLGLFSSYVFVRNGISYEARLKLCG